MPAAAPRRCVALLALAGLLASSCDLTPAQARVTVTVTGIIASVPPQARVRNYVFLMVVFDRTLDADTVDAAPPDAGSPMRSVEWNLTEPQSVEFQVPAGPYARIRVYAQAGIICPSGVVFATYGSGASGPITIPADGPAPHVMVNLTASTFTCPG